MKIRFGARWDSYEQLWAAGELHSSDGLEAMAYFHTEEEALAMVLGLEVGLGFSPPEVKPLPSPGQVRYSVSPHGELWALVRTCKAGVRKHLAHFPTRKEASSMLEVLNFDIGSPSDTYVIHSNVGDAEFHAKFDGPSVRITIEHNGDSEVTLTQRQLEGMLSSLGEMSEFHFNK